MPVECGSGRLSSTRARSASQAKLAFAAVKFGHDINTAAGWICVQFCSGILVVLLQLVVRSWVNEDVSSNWIHQIVPISIRMGQSLSVLPSTCDVLFGIVYRAEMLLHAVARINILDPELLLSTMTYAASLGIVGMFSGVLASIIWGSREMFFDENDPFGDIHPDSFGGWVIRSAFNIPGLLVKMGLIFDVIGLVVCVFGGGLVAWSYFGETAGLRRPAYFWRTCSFCSAPKLEWVFAGQQTWLKAWKLK